MPTGFTDDLSEDDTSTLLEAGMADLKAQIEELEKDIDPQELSDWLAKWNEGGEKKA